MPTFTLSILSLLFQFFPFPGPGRQGSGGGGGDGPNVWYYPGALTDTSFTSGPSTAGYEPQNYNYGNGISVATAGTATKLAFRGASGGGAGSFKIGLYNSGGSLLAQTTITGVTGTAGWYEGTINQAVSAGTYYVLVSCSDSFGQYYWNTGDDGSYATATYASSMAASVTINVEAGSGYGVRVYVD
jgi:hypothetical protein